MKTSAYREGRSRGECTGHGQHLLKLLCLKSCFPSTSHLVNLLLAYKLFPLPILGELSYTTESQTHTQTMSHSPTPPPVCLCSGSHLVTLAHQAEQTYLPFQNPCYYISLPWSFRNIHLGLLLLHIIISSISMCFINIVLYFFKYVCIHNYKFDMSWI